MTPIAQAQAILGRDFVSALLAHIQHGVVISRPDLFLMARMVPAGTDVSDPWRTWPAAECNAWFVWCGVGDAREMLRLMPKPLPWVGFYRCKRDWSENRWYLTRDLSARL